MVALGLGACNLVFGIHQGQPRGTGGGSESGSASGGGAEVCGTGGATSTSALAWTNGIATPGPTNPSLSASAVALGSGGTLVVTGAYSDIVSLGDGEPLPNAGDVGSNTSNVFVATYASKGGVLWAKGFDGPDDQRGNDVAVDAQSGDIVVTGQLAGSADLGLGTLTSAGSDDIFVARYTQSGTPIWTKTFGDANEQQGVKVAFDPQGNVILAAAGSGVVDFGNGNAAGDSSGSDGIFLVELDGQGVAQWARWFATGDFPASTLNVPPWVGVAVDATGTIVVTGPNSGADMSVLGRPSDAFRGGADVFLMALDSTGTLLWSHLFGGTGAPAENGDQWGNAVAVAPCGDIFVTGAFQASLEIGSLPVLINHEAPSPSTQTADIFIARFRHDGTPVWAVAFGDGGEQQGGNVSLDAQANVLVTGWLVDDANSQGIDLGDGYLWPPSGLSGAGDYRTDAFLVRLSADAAKTRFSRRMGDVEYQAALGSLTDPAGNIVVVGLNGGTMKYDDSPQGSLTDPFDGVDLFLLAAGP